MWYKGADYPTPYFLVNCDVVRRQFRTLTAELPGITPYYAMKANPAAPILTTLLAEGCGFEVASPAELELVLSLGGDPARIISSNPIKSPEFLQLLHQNGVRQLVFDSKDEVDKIARWAPDSQLVLRVQVDNSSATWPLSHKFGVPAEDAPALLRYAARRGLKPIGLTFHVGSQCHNPLSWPAALDRCAAILSRAAGEIDLRLINLGGGLPVRHHWRVPDLVDIAPVIRQALAEKFDKEMRFSIEPGRYLVGDAAVLVTRVIGRADRPDAQWLYFDSGVYHGLFDTLEQFHYAFDFDVEPTRRKSYYTLAGPTCDSLDRLYVRRFVPDLVVGEKLFVLQAGAYTGAIATRFNGFPPPHHYFIEEPVEVGSSLTAQTFSLF